MNLNSPTTLVGSSSSCKASFHAITLFVLRFCGLEARTTTRSTTKVSSTLLLLLLLLFPRLSLPSRLLVTKRIDSRAVKLDEGGGERMRNRNFPLKQPPPPPPSPPPFSAFASSLQAGLFLTMGSKINSHWTTDHPITCPSFYNSTYRKMFHQFTNL